VHVLAISRAVFATSTELASTGIVPNLAGSTIEIPVELGLQFGVQNAHGTRSDPGKHVITHWEIAQHLCRVLPDLVVLGRPVQPIEIHDAPRHRTIIARLSLISYFEKT
jgi:hypothetical protein